jgi:cell division protein FtsL
MSKQSRDQARRLNWLTEAQAAVGWAVIIFLAALLGAIYVRQASQIASVGRRVQIMQIDLEAIKRENDAIEQRIAEAQSLDRLQQEAIRLGFVQADPNDIEYIVVTEYPAENSAVESLVPTSTPEAIPPPPQTMGEAIWLRFSQNISGLVQGEARE